MFGKILTTYHVYWPNGNCERGQVEWPREPTLEQIRNLVRPYLDQGNLEHVTVLADGRRADMFVDEDGVQKGLPRNQMATRLYRTNWMTRHPRTDPETLPAVYGPAIVFDRIVWT